MELKIIDLTKKFKGFAAVDKVSYTFKNGVYGLLGANGAGKTTFMRMLCTLMKPSYGFITWNGRDIFDMGGEYRRLLGYLPQDFGYYPDFSVYDYLMYISSIKGLRPAVAKKNSELLLKQVGLYKMRNKKMKTLSGGMRRRAGIAQAMLNDPQILILDEPTSGLDPGERIRFRNLISELAEKRVVLLSTHIVSDVENIADEIILMKDGGIVMSGKADDLAATVQSSVWSVDLSKKESEYYMKKYKVANIKSYEGGVRLRILSEECPSEAAVQETPTLEDVFLHYFGERTGDDYDKI
ncbi:putative ABC transporter ATP-binding protein YxlF [Clostridiales bacterium]|nr:putative ABC transporter ATP-binding protein YxlF [Clostridiales bacterium]